MLSHRAFRRLLPVVFLTLVTAEVRADITIIGPGPGQVHQAGIVCGIYLDYVSPSPMEVEHLAPPSEGDTFTTTFDQDMADYPGWTLSFGSALNGTLTINQYDAYVDEGRGGGGGVIMNATYSPAASDPTELTYVQYYSSSLPDGQHGGGTHIDPHPNDDAEPMYYKATERAALGLTFSDSPFDPCPGAGSITTQYYTYLVSFDYATKELTTHDGWKWGTSFAKAFGPMSTLTAAPEPSSIVCLCLGVAALIPWSIVRRSRRSVIHTNR